jgi:membrane protein implicated in regulation of membrane protease activity
MFHVFMDFMCALACLVFAVPQGFTVTLDVAVLGTEFTVLFVTLHVSLALHALGTFVVVIAVVIFGMRRRHGLRKRNGTGQRKQRRKQGVFLLHGVAPLELSCMPTR